MKELINWVLERRYVVIGLAVIFAPNLSFISASVIALQTANRGPVIGIGDALIAALVMAFITLIAGGAAGMLVAGTIALSMGVVIGAGMRALRNLTLCIQGFVLVAYLLVLGYTLFGSTSNLVFDTMMSQITDLLRAQGMSDAEVDGMQRLQPRLIGIFAISIFVDVITVLFLSYWWRGIATGAGAFGADFRKLRLGYVLSIPGALICLATLVFENALVHNLFAVAACGFLLQALAFAHEWSHSQQWHPIFLVPVYLILVPMFLLFTLVGVLGVSPA